jgi:tRNA dimethylallyltransferase
VDGTPRTTPGVDLDGGVAERVDGGADDRPVRALLGPTATGKSELALEAARAARAAGSRPVEVVSVDAFSIYRGLTIASAAPSAAVRGEVAHHLVGVLDPRETLSVARFRALARAAIADVHARGGLPLLVGGSGLYWRAVVDDLDFPPTDPAVRARIEERLAGDREAAHAELARLDPTAAARIAVGNLRRVVRALEVIAITGRPFSSHDDAWSSYESVYADLEVAWLDLADDVLRARIEGRATAMVEAGLVDEVARLRAGELSRTAAAAIGVAEAIAVLDRQAPADGLAAAIAARTWRYVRRQRGWFRADPRCAPATPVSAREVLRGWVAG